MLLSCVQLLVVLAVLFAPGYLLARNLLEDEAPEASLPTGLALGFLLCGTLVFINLLAFGRPGPLVLAELGGLSVLLALRARKRKIPLRPPGRPVAAFLAFCVLCLAAQAATPSFAAAYTADWALYVPNFLVYAGLAAPSSVSEGVALEFFARRTPLYSWLQGLFLGSNLFSPTYANVQIVAVGLGASILWSVMGLARLAAPPAGRALLLAAVPLSPLLLRQICAPTPKALTAFLVLQAALFYIALRREEGPTPTRRTVVFSLLVVAAYLSHPSALLYLAWIGVDQAFGRLRAGRRLRWELLVGAALAALALALPWHLWLAATFGREALTPAITLKASSSLPAYLGERVGMILTTLALPSVVIDAAQQQGPPLQWAHSALRFYWESFLGGFTLAGTALLALAWRKGAPLSPALKLSLLGGGLGALTCVLVHVAPDYKGHAGNIMLPLYVVALAVAWLRIEERFGPRLALVALLALETVLVQLLQRFATAGTSTEVRYLSQRLEGPLDVALSALLAAGALGAYLVAAGFFPRPDAGARPE